MSNTGENIISILHLSDLHLGQVTDEKELNLVFGSFFEKIGREQIDYVALSGDISYRNLEKGYELCEHFLNKLPGLKKKTRFSNLFICPGNHDLDQQELRNNLSRIGQAKPATENKGALLENIENVKQLNDAFQRYNAFCQDHLSRYNGNINRRSCYTYGFQITDNACFLMLNSAWFCAGGKLRDEDGRPTRHSRDLEDLYLGKKLVKDLVESARAKAEEEGRDWDELLKVTLVHHPPNWLDWSEKYTNGIDGKLKSSWDLVLDFSDIILTGHEHIEIRKPSWVHHTSLLFQAGPSYVQPGQERDFHPNHICLLKINTHDHTVARKLFSYEGKKDRSGAVWNSYEENRICSLVGNCSSPEACAHDCPFEYYHYRRPLLFPNYNLMVNPPGGPPAPAPENINRQLPDAPEEELISLEQTIQSGHKPGEQDIHILLSAPSHFYVRDRSIVGTARNELLPLIRDEIMEKLLHKAQASSSGATPIILLMLSLDPAAFSDQNRVTIRSLVGFKKEVVAIVDLIMNGLNSDPERTVLRNLLLKREIKVLVRFGLA